MKIPDIFVPEKDLEDNIKKLLKNAKRQGISKQKYDNLKIIRVDSYVTCITELKEKGQKPLTFSDNIEARIADYEANGDDTALFKTGLDSVTGIAYKAKSTKFKIILRSKKLENIKPDFNRDFIPVDYGAEKGVELDSRKGKYNQFLTRKEAKNHEFWIAVMNGNKEKLARYVDICFNKTGAKKGMSVFLIKNTSQDELRALAINYYPSSDNSEVRGDLSLKSLPISSQMLSRTLID